MLRCSILGGDDVDTFSRYRSCKVTTARGPLQKLYAGITNPCGLYIEQTISATMASLLSAASQVRESWLSRPYGRPVRMALISSQCYRDFKEELQKSKIPQL